MAHRPTTLTWRVTVRLAAAAVIALAVQTFWAAWTYQFDPAELGELEEDAVERVLETLATRLRPDGTIGHFHPGRYDFATVRYASINQQGERVAGELVVPPDLLSRAAQVHELFLTQPTPGGNRWIGARKAMTAEGRPFVIFTQVDFRQGDYPVEVLVAEVLETALFPTLPIVVVMYLVSVLAMRRSLSGLKRAAREARSLDPQRRGQRISDSGLPQEVLSLVQAVNSGIAALERQLAEQRAFAGEVAHELRTPLAIMTLELNKLQGPQGDRLREDVAAMARRVEQLLAVARAGALRLNETDRADLSEITADVTGRYAPIAMRRGVTLELEGDGPCPVIGDSTAIGAALLNIIENAVKASPPDGIVRIIMGPGPMVRVADQGPGIDPAIRDQLFEPYARGDSRGAGTGLGLSIVRRTMEAHGGSITMADTPEGGTNVILRFRKP